MTYEVRPRSKIFLPWDRPLAQNFEVILAVIVKLDGDPIFAKFCQDALQLILRHPQIYILQFGTGGIGKNNEIHCQVTLMYAKLH